MSGYDALGKTVQFKVYSADEYLKKMRKAQGWNIALMAIGGAFEANAAGTRTSTTTSNTSANIYGSDGTSYTGSASTYSTTTTRDRAAEAEVKARNRDEINTTAEQYKQINAATERGLLKVHTLFPDQSIEGTIIVKMNKMYAAKFVVNIPAGLDMHTITFIPKQ